MTDPWLAPGAPRPTGVLPPAQPHPQHQPYAPPFPQQAAGFGFPAPLSSHRPGSGRGIAITASWSPSWPWSA